MDIEMSSDGTGGTVFTPEEEDREAWEMIGVSRVGVAIPDNDALLEVLMPFRHHSPKILFRKLSAWLLHGAIRFLTLAPGSAHNPKPLAADPKAPYAHPYFWASFILIGHWR